MTKILPVNTAILVDMQSTEFDIVVMVDGVSQPIRTITLPNEEITNTKKLNLIAAELERTIKFYDTNNAEKPLPADLPIYVSGELLGKTDLQKILAEATGHPMKDLLPDYKGIEQLDPGRYLTNVAMVVDNPSSIRASTFDAADMNLLPAPYQIKPPSLLKLVGIPVGAALAGLAIYLVILMQSNTGKIAEMQASLDTTNQQINIKLKEQNSLKAEIADKEKSITELKKLYEGLNLAKSLLDTQHEIVNGDVELMLSKLSSNIKLNNIKLAGGNLTIVGIVPNQNDLYYYAQEMLRYARALDQSYRFSESTIIALEAEPSVTGEISVEDQGVTGIQFTLTFVRGNGK
jgi:hypothetical protein